VPQPQDHAVRNGVAIAVASAVILAVVWWAWKLVCAAISWFCKAMALRVVIPAWLFGLLLVSGVIALGMILRTVIPHGVREPNWQDYDVDAFFGMIWRWSYYASGSIGNLWCFCPRCDTELMAREDGWKETLCTNFFCETWGATMGRVPGDGHTVLSKVERQIRRKLRTDEWKKVLSREGSAPNP